MTVNNSRRPSSIPPIISHFAASGNVWKVPVGPLIEPSPGPTFATDVAALDKAVKKSNPSIPSPKATTEKVKNHIKKNDNTENMISSEIGRRL